MWLAGAFAVFPVGWLALAPFFFLLEDLPARSRFRWGYLSGFLSYFAINWWLLPTITRASPVLGAPPVLGALLSFVAVALIALIHGSQFALVALFWDRNRFSRFPILLPIFAALGWGALDWLRSQGPIAHMWGALAFSQTTDLALLQSAFWLGQHGLSALCALFAACAVVAWKSQKIGVFGFAAALFTVLHGVGLARLATPIETRGLLRVLVAQTAVSSLSKNIESRGEAPATQALRLTRGAKTDFDLLVWPETTLQFQKSGALYGGLDWEVGREQKRKKLFLAGALVTDERGQLFNEAVLVAPDGSAQSSGKRRLVPFGERAPFVAYFPFLQIFAPRPALEPGAPPKVLEINGLRIGTLICFESCFPNPALDLARQNADILVFLTNDEWFVGTEAPRQHAAMAALRAVECDLPVIQSANGGYSFLIDPRGRFVVSTSFGSPQILPVAVPLRSQVRHLAR